MYPNTGRRTLFLLYFIFNLFPFRAANGFQTASEAGKTTNKEVYEPGGTVKSPKLIHYVEPEFSSESKEAFIEGTVKISTVVTPEGHPSESHVVRGLNAEEDRTALEALKQWRFQPGTKEGKPVNVKVTIEIAFHLL